MKNEIDPPLAGKRALRRQDRRQTIIDAARRAFLEDGYAATSMSALVATLGGSKATLWSYFRTKEELFAAVIDDVTGALRQELESVLLTASPLDETLLTFCRGFMAKIMRSEAVAAWRMIVGESGRFPELGQIFYEKAPQRVERALATYIDAQIALGLLRDDGSDRMAQMLVGLCATQHNRRLWGVGSIDDAELDQAAREYVGYFLRLFAAGRPD